MVPIDIVAALTPIITAKLESYINSSLDKVNLNLQRKSEISASISDYSNRTYQKLYYLKTIIYQDKSFPLLDLYHPLKVIALGEVDSTEINSNCLFFLEEHDKILITDYAGMGKSTISKFMYLTDLTRYDLKTP
ncbi:hypothetical protein [Deinococcus marmoris]|uniref:hypothetical protein n=1 Tax=Deinococcus marmoris TaxID=249408 RepID=UPI0012DE7F16|nr:hypothetical protein [Deinococcus marmoris]